MIRLHVIAEGQTEQNFVKRILAPHLALLNITAFARCVLTSKDKGAAKEYRGGVPNYGKAKNDIQTWLREDRRGKDYFTTMFDLYGLPKDFPGYSEANTKTDPYEKIKILENCMAENIRDSRFIPYIQLHEFEALILAAPQQLDWEYLEHDRQIKALLSMVGKQNPELINDGPETAPSKRILKEIPAYNKATAGPAVAEKIGLPTLRAKCPHFNEWLSKLENLAGGNS